MVFTSYGCKRHLHEIISFIANEKEKRVVRVTEKRKESKGKIDETNFPIFVLFFFRKVFEMNILYLSSNKMSNNDEILRS